MKRFLSVMLCLTFAIANAISQGFPTISTENETKWYLIQFMNGGNALTAENPGENITTAAAIGSKAQLWKITGDATKGYTFTNKKGYTFAHEVLEDTCIGCASCAIVCPDGCISVYKVKQ